MRLKRRKIECSGSLDKFKSIQNMQVENGYRFLFLELGKKYSGSSVVFLGLKMIHIFFDKPQ
jgi:hypothetical protein